MFEGVIVFPDGLRIYLDLICCPRVGENMEIHHDEADKTDYLVTKVNHVLSQNSYSRKVSHRIIIEVY